MPIQYGNGWDEQYHAALDGLTSKQQVDFVYALVGAMSPFLSTAEVITAIRVAKATNWPLNIGPQVEEVWLKG